MIALSVSMPQLQMFFLVFLRTGAFLMAIPLLNSSSVPVIFRLALTLAASLLLFPLLGSPSTSASAGVLSLSIAATGEVLIGILAGLAIRLVFEGVQLAGELAGYQMGLAIAEVIDPASEDQVAILAQFTSLLATVIFLILNGHHWFIRTLVESCHMIPPGGFHVNGAVLERLARMTGEMFLIGLKAGAPVIVALLLGTVAFGLVARAVPQMNIFVVSMPLNIGVGLVFFGLSLPHLAGYLKHLFGSVAPHAIALLKAIA